MRRGYASTEVLGRRFGDLGIWSSGAPTFEEFLNNLANRGSIRGEKIDLCVDGQIVSQPVSAAFIQRDGENCALLSFHTAAPAPTVSDVSSLASGSKLDFLTDLLHEIRTPLNAILAMADLLSEVRLPDEGRKFVDAMLANGNTLLDLVNSVLDLDKIETGRLDLEPVVFEIEELIDYVAGIAATTAHRKNVEIIGRIMPGAPRKVVGDPLRMRQILLNLVCNAVEATDAGEVLISVEGVQGPDKGSHKLRFTITDTGAGIPQKQVDEMNQRFSQEAGAGRANLEASGLGLSIVRGLLELMGGHLLVQSEVGKGSTFSFEVGLEAVEGRDMADPFANVDLSGVHILVVNDNRAKRQKIKTILSSWGAEVAETNSGVNALTEWYEAGTRGNPYRLALVDCALPDMDGFELAKRLRERSDTDQRIIMMFTFDDLNSNVARAKAEGITDYVLKPVTRSELYSGVTNALDLTPASIETTRLPKGAEQIASKRLHILVVEDSEYNCMVVRAFLKNKPFVLDFAENGAIGVEKFTGGEYDLVLMDIRMPVMNGYEATRKIRAWELEQNRTPIPIVALTAAALEQDIQESMLAGCTAHLSKPIKKMLLLETIRDVTESDSDSISREGNRMGGEMLQID